MNTQRMTRTRLAVFIALTVSGGALAAPFSVSGAELSVEGGLSDNGSGLVFQLDEGVVPNNPLNPNIQNANPALAETVLFGAHSGVPPASGPFDIAGYALVAATDPYTSSGDQSFSVGFSIVPAAEYVNSAPIPSSADAVWIARLPETALITSLQIGFSFDPGTLHDFVVDGPIVLLPSVDGLHAFSMPASGSDSFIDIYVGVPPAPGALGLFGAVAVVGTRRRRS